MQFITGQAEIGQCEESGKWQTLHNQIFEDKDNVIYLVPRYYKTDGYTIPNWITWLGGGKLEWDLRPAIQHDFECQYHQAIIITKSLEELKELNLLKSITKNNTVITICKDIPIEYLKIVDVSFNEVNSRFKRCMLATGLIKEWRINLMRSAVNLNIGWLFSGKKKFDLDKIYKKN